MIAGRTINGCMAWGSAVRRRTSSSTTRTMWSAYRFTALQPVPFQANRKTGDGLNTQETLGFYVQDMIELSPHWKALLSVRYDEFDQTFRDDFNGKAELERTDYTLSPRAGLVWQPDEVQSYYLSVSRSYQPSGEMFQVSASNVELDPEETTNYELGANWNLLQDQLTLTAAVFRLERNTQAPLHAAVRFRQPKPACLHL